MNSNNNDLKRAIEDAHRKLIEAKAVKKYSKDNGKPHELTEQEARIRLGEEALAWNNPSSNYPDGGCREARNRYLNRIALLEDQLRQNGENNPKAAATKIIEYCKQLALKDRHDKGVNAFMSLTPRERYLVAGYQHVIHNNPNPNEQYQCWEGCEHYEGDKTRTIEDNKALDYFNKYKMTKGVSYCDRLQGRLFLYCVHNKNTFLWNPY